ncbi:MAG: hypothetical protein CME88_13915 [Hirschia sp.]|nr:hypothetical protein [Hirschia sp.]MBF19468.1 hypothetical protein [Hirschia sp.]
MAKTILDLDKLVADGSLSAEDANRLKGLGEPSNRIGVFINLFCILGALAVAAGVVALEPSPAIGLLLALVALGGGAALYFTTGKDWRVLAHGLVIMGCVGLVGWMAWQAEETWPDGMGWVVHLFAFMIFTGAAVIFRQPFLAALSPLALGALVGSGTAYWHASYGIFVREATLSILLFSAVAGWLYWLRNRLDEAWQGITTVAARVSFFMVNFAFWVGSLWGDWIGEMWAAPDRWWGASQEWREHAIFIHEGIFSIGWLAFLVACIWLGTRDHRRFLANTAVVFLAIHAYTQLFETLGAAPWTLVIAGLSMVGVAAGVARFDAWQKARAA